MNPVIEVIVSTTGQTQVRTRGFSGSSCREASQFLEQALGQRVTEQLTPEFHQPSGQSIGQQQHLNP